MEPKIGIIGCGNIARFHVEGLVKANANITYFADIRLDSAKKYAERFQAKYTADYNELIASCDVDTVLVLVSSAFHRDICLKTLGLGKNVICEKTMSGNAAEALEIAQAAKNSKGLFFTSFMKRQFPAAKQAKELLAKLGEVITARVWSYQPWGNFYTKDHGWDMDAVLKNYGGAITKCAGSHMLDMCLYLLGRPESVYGDVRYYPESKFDICTSAILGYAGGGRVFFETAAHPLKRIGFRKDSWDEGAEITGTNGRICLYLPMWDQPDKNPAYLSYYDNQSETLTEYRYDIVNPFTAQSAYFMDCLRANEQKTPDVQSGYDVDLLIETICKSSEAKNPLTLNYRF